MQNALAAIVQKLQSGQFNAAAKQARAAHKKQPKRPEFAKFAGIALNEMNKHAEAIRFLSKALQLAPGDPVVRQYLILSLLALGQGDKAVSALQNWIRKTPEDAELHYLLASCFLQQQDYPATIKASGDALRLRPNMSKALMMRGFAHFESSDAQSALADFEAARALEPQNTGVLLNIGSVLNDLYRFDESAETFRKAVRIAPNDAELRQNLGTVLMEQGQFDEAREQFRATLNLDPDNIIAITGLIEMRQPDEIAALRKLAEARLGKPFPDEDSKANLEIALANLLLAAGDRDAAATLFSTSNKRRARTQPYDPSEAERWFESTMRLFPSDHTPRSGSADPALRPIFVIGLPRSGTTLTEQILTAHSTVEGLGEFGALNEIGFQTLKGAAFGPKEHAETYLKHLPDLAPTTEVTIDKLPANYLFVGFLAEAFPKARFVCVERDPREVAFSMWQRHFKGSLNSFASRMDWMAHNANLYRQYMKHWGRLFPDRIMTIHYQDMVSDVGQTAERLAKFCDLEWEEEMAAPERNTAAVRTASVRQVREGVHKASLGKWRTFEEELQPFIDHLDPALWPDLET